jgi:hypothetical protein
MLPAFEVSYTTDHGQRDRSLASLITANELAAAALHRHIRQISDTCVTNPNPTDPGATCCLCSSRGSCACNYQCPCSELLSIPLAYVRRDRTESSGSSLRTRAALICDQPTTHGSGCQTICVFGNTDLVGPDRTGPLNGPDWRVSPDCT